jgi:DNA (cytosine-5)-methyltransferase 1
MISATLFSGGGLADLGLAAAGYRPVWGIEYHQPAAEIYQLNFGHNPLKDLLAAQPGDYPTPDYLHLSNPCQRFSLANPKKGEKVEDTALAERSTEFIRWHQPARLSIENVPGYKGSDSFKLLVKAVEGIYPYHTINTPDFAQFGVPQNRKRLILRAAFEPISPLYLSYTHREQSNLLQMSFEGWESVLHDILDDFDVSRVTEKQMKAIRRAEPAFPILIQRVGVYPGKFAAIREAHQPSWTILASKGGDNDSGNRTKVIDVITQDGICRSLNIRAVARLMSVPDSYQFPENAQWHECWRVLGNGVPPLAMQRIAESFDHQIQQPTGIKRENCLSA